MRADASAHAHVKRRRRLDERQLTEQAGNLLKLLDADPARRARREMLLEFAALAPFQAAVRIREDSFVHLSTAHNG